MSTKKNESNSRTIQAARKEADKICKMKKKRWINNRIKKVEEAHKRNDTRKFFKDIRALQNDRSSPIFACKDENGTQKQTNRK